MEIVKAEVWHADIIGRVHSEAWKQAYKDVFPDEYLNVDTPEKRMQEFLDSCKEKDFCYYMICEEDQAVGIIKLIDDEDICEISSLYILEKYRNRGFGKQVIEYLRKEFYYKKLMLWVLEENIRARRFYENNGFKNTGNARTIQRGKLYEQLQYELLPEVWAYEMYYDGKINMMTNISCTPFTEDNFEEYMCIYNECFYEMRKVLDIEPYNWYSQYSQIIDKAENIFLLFEENQIIGSVACYGNEIDDLIVRKSHQHRGYGKELLLWAMNHIRQNNDSAITLHVAELNKGALGLYKKVGFLVSKREKVR